MDLHPDLAGPIVPARPWRFRRIARNRFGTASATAARGLLDCTAVPVTPTLIEGRTIDTEKDVVLSTHQSQ